MNHENESSTSQHSGNTISDYKILKYLFLMESHPAFLLPKHSISPKNKSAPSRRMASYSSAPSLMPIGSIIYARLLVIKCQIHTFGHLPVLPPSSTITSNAIYGRPIRRLLTFTTIRPWDMSWLNVAALTKYALVPIC